MFESYQLCLILSHFQYLFIVVKKTVGICNDELFGTYFDTLIFIASTSTALIYNWVPGKMGLNYYICTGQDPDLYNNLRKKYPVSLIIPVFTITIYGYISVRLVTAKKSLETAGIPSQPNIEKPNGLLSRIFPFVNKWARSSMQLGTLYVSMIAVVSDAYFWMMKTNQMTPYEVKTSTAGKFGYFWHTFALPGVVNLLVAFRIFSQEKDFKKRKFIQSFFLLSSKFHFLDVMEILREKFPDTFQNPQVAALNR